MRTSRSVQSCPLERLCQIELVIQGQPGDLHALTRCIAHAWMWIVERGDDETTTSVSAPSDKRRNREEDSRRTR